MTNYFGFNKQQRNGLIVLMFLSFTLLIIRLSLDYFIKPSNIEIKNLALIENKLDSAETIHKYDYQTKSTTKKIIKNLFVFNPNTVNNLQLKELGFSEKTASTFLKFRTKGFVFKQKKDLLKIYGVSQELYLALEPFILIDNIEKQNPFHEPKINTVKPVQNTKQSSTAIEINTADSASLVRLNGIGPSYAKRILKYRTILGGYVSINQLKEVYGFTEEIFQSLKPLFTVNATLIKKININKDDFKTVNKHPYLTYELTKIIFNWRNKTIITATNLKDILNDNSMYEKLIPYLVFE